MTVGKTQNLLKIIFSKNSTTQENIKTVRLKENCKTYTEKKTSKQKLNQ